MKLLFCIDHLRADGSQRVLGQLVAGLTARRHQVAVLCLNDSWDEAVRRELLRHRAEVRIVGKKPLLGGYGLLGLLRWIRKGHFDVAVTMLFFADVVGRSLAHAAGVPWIVSSIRARNVDYALWQLLLVRATMPWADRVIINGRATSAFAVSAEGVRPDRLAYIPNGVVADDYAAPKAREALRAELGLAPESRLAGVVGRLTHQKGLDVLLDALAEPGLALLNLFVAGVGEEQGRLMAQAQRLGIAERIHFAGYRRDVPHILGALDLYAHPARFEGMPNALLEAMAAGCPIVATNVDGNSELIEDGAHGWLVPVGNASALAAALRQALADPAEARRRGDAAAERARQCFSVDAMVEAWEKALRPGR